MEVAKGGWIWTDTSEGEGGDWRAMGFWTERIATDMRAVRVRMLIAQTSQTLRECCKFGKFCPGEEIDILVDWAFLVLTAVPLRRPTHFIMFLSQRTSA